MTVQLTWQTILTAAGIIGAVVAIVTYLRKLFGWFEKQEMQDKAIKEMKEEQSILTAAMLAALKGLVELGCDGVVKEQITALETFLNNKAHKA